MTDVFDIMINKLTKVEEMAENAAYEYVNSAIGKAFIITTQIKLFDAGLNEDGTVRWNKRDDNPYSTQAFTFWDEKIGEFNTSPDGWEGERSRAGLQIDVVDLQFSGEMRDALDVVDNGYGFEITVEQNERAQIHYEGSRNLYGDGILGIDVSGAAAAAVGFNDVRRELGGRAMMKLRKEAKNVLLNT